MVSHTIVVDAADYISLFSEFCEDVYRGSRKRIEYQTYRQLRKDPKATVNFYFLKDGLVEMWVNGLWQWTGCKDDESFGAFLWDYFHEELKDVMYKNNDKTKFEYDIWGVKSEVTDSLVGESSNNCATSAVSAYDTTTTTTWAGDPYYGYSDAQIAINTKATEITCECKGVDKVKNDLEMLQDKIKVLEDELAMKADKDEMYYLSDRVRSEMDSSRVLIDENAMRIEDLEYLERKRHLREQELKEAKSADAVQCTSSNVYPQKNYKIDYMPGIDERKEKENMDTNKMFNGFEFGPVDDRIKMSPYGMAIRNADGRYVSYDAKTGNIMDVEVFNFDNHKLIWKMPVAVSALAVGDTIIHMKKPMFITSVTNNITAIDIFNGEVKIIVPAQNMFGFNFVTKVISLFNFTGDNTPSAENPFGNIMPFMLMGNEDMDMKDFFMMMAVANGGNMNNMFQTPLMLYAMMNDNDSMKEMLPFVLMSQNGLFGQTTPVQHECHCGQHNGENH